MPNRFVPISVGTSTDDAYNAINRSFAELDNESVVKTFNGPKGKPALIQGKLSSNADYGTEMRSPDGDTRMSIKVDKNGASMFVVYDSTNTPRILIGTSPSNTVGLWVSNVGVNVLSLFT